jgi:hypothetical protein
MLGIQSKPVSINVVLKIFRGGTSGAQLSI